MYVRSTLLAKSTSTGYGWQSCSRSGEQGTNKLLIAVTLITPFPLVSFLAGVLRLSVIFTHGDSGRNELSFYTVPEYEVWKETHDNGKGWNAKYYKVCILLSYCADYVVKFASPSCVRFISFGFLLATTCVWVWMICSLHSVTTGSRDRANVPLIIIIIIIIIDINDTVDGFSLFTPYTFIRIPRGVRCFECK